MIRLIYGGGCRRSGNRGTQTCLPVAHDVALSVAYYGPSSASTSKTLTRGQASRGRQRQDLLEEQLTRAGS
jgi:hypothetical protein